ncbi:hypothetical protein LWI28_004727 [Acer negundo]|uniref:Uncharacterized protein n=1 Tax=Acer negundo TaxID=4023 RepID=A0AAD5JCR0_ACENE|nr:hypothetical protein LWI28_004727 [Acer negundo]
MEEEGGRRRRLVLVPYPLQGHITPMLQLGTILHSRGFSITIALSKFDFPDTSNHPDFVFQPLSNDSLSKFNDPDDIVALISNLNLSYRVSLQKLLIEMIEKQQLEQQDHQELPCIIYDPLVYSAEAVAHHLKLPSIVLPPSSVAFLLAFYACPKIEKEGYTPFQESKSLELVPEFLNLLENLPLLRSTRCQVSFLSSLSTFLSPLMRITLLSSTSTYTSSFFIPGRSAFNTCASAVSFRSTCALTKLRGNGRKTKVLKRVPNVEREGIKKAAVVVVGFVSEEAWNHHRHCL